jgi:hypothetical protein
VEAKLELERTRRELRIIQQGVRKQYNECDGRDTTQSAHTESAYLATKCLNCNSTKKQLHNAQEEISSYKEIIKMLQAELKVITRQLNHNELTGNNAYHIQNEVFTSECDWEITTGNETWNMDVANNNLIQIIPTSMSDKVHNLQHEVECTKARNNRVGVENNAFNNTLYVGRQRKYKQKIRLIGESHVKKCAAELREALDPSYEIIGLTRPGASMKEILKTAENECISLNKSDFLENSRK